MSCAAYRLRPALRKGHPRINRHTNHCTNPRPSRSAGTPAALAPLPRSRRGSKPPNPPGARAVTAAPVPPSAASWPAAPASPIRFDTYAEWASVITIMVAAYSTYGEEGARGIYTTLARGHPQLAALVDPRAWEALLLLLEICNILDLVPTVVEHIFGAGMRAHRNLDRRDPPAPPPIAVPHPTPPRLGLAPHEFRPRLYPIDRAGIIWLHDLDHPAPE
jgi:hypothetical protein